ncbi:MAG: polyribonucleotide nucleotidyltransferase [Synergistota bacterium]|jgi:polyribonucleotide nucleotidyltransferase|nr:polyribonucleotide nucleotidyltransferase [Synergistota bacterium]OPZ40959.1 MAG: Polyribonucleotide nucleotidyltransferase [Synergistetes bacterium ADurb.BinA166]
MEKTFSVEIGGRPLQFSTGKVAKQANGAVVAAHGETTVLTTACITEKPRTGIDFFPLLVDFEERFYSAGKIPGGFIKREGRPSETAVLSCRMVDRSIRSLFDESMRYDVHVVSTVLSVDQVNPPNVLAINAASAALSISDIPWGGPVGAVRIGRVEDEFVVNPTEEQMAVSTLDLLVAGHLDGVTMVECGSKEISEELLVDALELAQAEIRKIVGLFNEMSESVGRPKLELPAPPSYQAIDSWAEENLSAEIREAVMIHEKKPRGDAISAARNRLVERFEEEHPDAGDYMSGVIDGMVKRIMRSLIVDERIRADGRRMDELRKITCETGVLPRVHGSALFTRGETQALVVTTLGMMGVDDQILDGLKQDEPAKRFILHYNFPPFSVGEVRPMRGPGRREIGHGALAERALRAMIPEEEDFPYVMRVVSDILESNGSSSQASICGGSLALMEAGVPMKKHVAGIAMGLIKEDDRVAVLTDIQGLEDHFGDMDFKVAGTRDGVTALQMDNKAGGITREILEQALSQARSARMQILDAMEAAIPAPAELSPNAPRIFMTTIDPEKIRDVIGPGGKVIRGITQKTGVKINVEDSGEIYIGGPTQEKVNEALSIIRGLTKDLEAGEVYHGTVTRLMTFGAFVECLPGKEGLLHVSEVSTRRIPKVEDVFKVGDKVLVMVKEIDDMGRVNLTRRRILDDESRIAAEGLSDVLPAERERESMIEALAEAGRNNPQPERDRPREGGAGRDRGDRRPGGGGPRRHSSGRP